MATLDDIPKTYDAAVRTLAEWHSGSDLPDLEVYSFDDPQGNVVRLLEVSSQFPATGKVVAYPFGRSETFPFKSAVAQISPQEWDRVKQGQLPLPAGWDLSTAQKVRP